MTPTKANRIAAVISVSSIVLIFCLGWGLVLTSGFKLALGLFIVLHMQEILFVLTALMRKLQALLTRKK
jgi:hypothetical protein